MPSIGERVLEKKRSYIIFLGTLLLLVSLVVPATITVVADDDAPALCTGDCQCDDLGGNSDATDSWETDDVVGLYCEYIQSPEAHRTLTIKIIYCYETEYVSQMANTGFLSSDKIEILLKDEEEKPDYYIIVEAIDDTNRRSLLYTTTDQDNYYSGKRSVIYDDHYVIRLECSGYDFSNVQMFEDNMNRLEQHAFEIIQLHSSKEVDEEEYTEEPALIAAVGQKMGYTRRVSGLGVTEIKRHNSDTWVPARNSQSLFEGDELRTHDGGRCELMLERGTRLIRMESNSSLVVPMIPKKVGRWEVIKGRFWILIEELLTGKVEIRTPNAIAGVKGTEFEIIVEEDGTSIFNVIDGVVEVSDINETKTVTVNAGETAICKRQGLPSDPEPLNIDSADKWWESFLEETDPTDLELASESGSGSGSNAVVIIVPIVIIAAIAAAIFVFFRRRAKAVPVSPIPAPSDAANTICNQCGNQVPRDAAFCKKCGSKM